METAQRETAQRETPQAETFTVQVKWTVSRGRDTYGYNICSLYVPGSRWSQWMKVASCMGGGYDMVGTVFADWLVIHYQDRLKKLADRVHAQHGKNFPYTVLPANEKTLYGLTRNTDSGNMHLDGACGIESVRSVANAIGIDWTSLGGRSKNETVYSVTDKGE